SFKPGSGNVMTRNPDWWGLAENPHNIDRLIHLKIADAAEAAAALRDGTIDLWISVPPERVDELVRRPDLVVQHGDDFFTIYLGFDQGSPELRTSNVKGANLFRDRRVRQATYQAIDIEAIRTKIMLGYARPAGMLVAPGFNGYSKDLDRRLSYDRE